MFLLSLALSHAQNGAWVGDFWEHSAVVRELTRHPAHPQHPLYESPLPHAFYSPYALGVALAARAGRATSIDALAVAGIFNLLLLMLGIQCLSRALFPDSGAAFYALLFFPLLWGHSPPFFSGFLHWNGIGFNLPYPSTFALALLLFAWTAAIRVGQGHPLRWGTILTVLLALLYTTHLPTGVAASIGVACFVANAPAGKRAESGSIALFALAAAFLLACAWPYYSFWSLVWEESAKYHRFNIAMYVDVLPSHAAALIGLPALALRGRKNLRDPLLTTFGFLLLFYAAGDWTHRWGWGRVLPSMVLILQLATAGWVASTENRRWPWSRPTLVYAVAIGTTCVAMLIHFTPGMRRYLPKESNPSRRYDVLREHVGADSVVLADSLSSLQVPSYAGKVVATRPALAFIPDQSPRLAAVESFFTAGTPEKTRRDIFYRYDVEFLLIDRTRVPQSVVREIIALGRILVARRDLFLLAIDDQRPRSQNPNTTAPRATTPPAQANIVE